MIKYDVEYIDKLGDKQEFVVPSVDVRTAMKILFELCPDARRIVSCKPQSTNNVQDPS